MEFLDKLVLPQSEHHLHLLEYILMLTLILFLPYLSALTGSTLLSVWFNKKGRRSGDAKYLRFSKSLIDLVTFNKSITFGLGIIPILSAMFCYAQLLHLGETSVSLSLLFSLITFIISVIAVYAYKHSFHLQDLLSLLKNENKDENIDESTKSEIDNYRWKNANLNKRSGLYGIIFLFITAYLFIGAMELASESNRWGSDYPFLNIIFSLSTFTYFLYFILLSIAVTSAIVLYTFFRPNADHNIFDQDYLGFVKNYALKSGLISTITLPLFILLNIISTDGNSLSFGIYLIAVLAFLLLMLISIFYYIMIKESSAKYSSSVVFMLLIFFSFMVIKDHSAFNTSYSQHINVLAKEYTKYETEFKSQFGGAAVEISGADIYNGRCIACHQFDRKVVGPPYNETLPKYEGKIEDLVKYILNPKKINPEYPAMPNQGLKPSEAKAVAEYIMQTYQSGK
ncbi:MAG: c-type cytochrome [Melioribacteraceae bacterium]|nr:c-type cytochrome [Melioribacteraceae bacterium]MCF8354416.1 c-type cytochrome [Melioribacteraceae bacterium]MCF8392987.1 c-type cytochrome [Melioribacteraceae bacterium]MCF8417270.1 c-type cytochrome [Melioribacteraceae bacterium]